MARSRGRTSASSCRSPARRRPTRRTCAPAGRASPRGTRASWSSWRATARRLELAERLPVQLVVAPGGDVVDLLLHGHPDLWDLRNRPRAGLSRRRLRDGGRSIVSRSASRGARPLGRGVPGGQFVVHARWSAPGEAPSASGCRPPARPGLVPRGHAVRRHDHCADREAGASAPRPGRSDVDRSRRRGWRSCRRGSARSARPPTRSLPPWCSTKRPPPVSSTHQPSPAHAMSPGCSAKASARTQKRRSPCPPGRVPLTLRIRLPGGITEDSVTRLKSATPACCRAWSNADRSVRPAPEPVRIEMSSPPASGRVLCDSSSCVCAIRSSSRR